MRVGIFDSGIGGLTVLKEIVKSKPQNEYIYVGDTLNVPYGNKNKEELLKLSKSIIDYLISKEVDIIIIACGTVSSNIGNVLKQIYNIPIIDIISPTLEALKKSKYKNIGVIATHMTVNSKIFSKSLDDRQVFELECPKLVPAIENNDENVINNTLNNYLQFFKGQNIELLILGCTHYPIVENNINCILENKISIFNMATPIIDMLADKKISDKSYVEINMTALNTKITTNINRILEDIDYNINFIKLN